MKLLKILLYTLITMLSIVSFAYGSVSVEFPIVSGGDDVEEIVSSGSLTTSSSDLEWGYDTSRQYVGLRFQNVELYGNESITNATFYIDFKDTSPSGSINISVEYVDNCAAYSGSYAVSSRTYYSTVYTATISESYSSGFQYYLPINFSNLVQAVIDRPSWNVNNSMCFKIHDLGSKYMTIDSYDTAGTPPSLVIDYTASAGGGDTTPPVISSVANTSLTNVSAIITWNTDEASNSSVFYGTTTSLGSFEGLDDSVTSHSISLSGLTPNTTYYYKVGSCDASGNCANSTQYNFTTNETVIIPPSAPTYNNISQTTINDYIGQYIRKGYDFLTTTPQINAQTFKLPEGALIEEIQLALGRVNAASGVCRVYIYNSTAGSSSPTVQNGNYSEINSAEIVNTGINYINFTFTNDKPYILANNLYWLLIGCDSSTMNAKAYGSNTDTVSSASAYYKGEGSTSYIASNTTSGNVYDLYYIINYTSVTTNYTITVLDEWDNTPINNVSITIAGYGTYTNSTGNTIYTNVEVNHSNTYNLTITGQDYYSKNINNHNLSDTSTFNLYQSVINFSTYELVSNNSLTGITYTINGTNDTIFYLKSGSYTVTTSKTGYYDKVSTFSVAALDNKTINITGLYTTVLNISIYEETGILSNTSTTVTVNSTTYNYSDSYTITGSKLINITGGEYSFSISGGYAPTTQSFNISNVSDSINLTAYNTNTLLVTFRNSFTEAVVNNVSITFFSDLFSGSDTTSNGSILLTMAEPGDYILQYNATGYDANLYFVTITNETFTSATLYLNPSSSTTSITVNIVDEGLSPVENAQVKALKHFASTNTYKEVAAGVTNPDGETVMDLVTGTNFYKFTVILNGVTVETTNPFIITGTTIQIQITTTQNALEYRNLIGDISATLTFNELTNNFRYDFSDSGLNNRQYCLYTYRSGVLQDTLVNSTCTTGSSGTILHSVVNTSGLTYYSEAYATISSSDTLIAKTSYTFGSVSFGNAGLVIQILLTLLFSLAGFAAVELLFLTAPLSIVLGGVIGLHSIGLAYTVPLLIVGIIIMFMLRRNS